MFKLNSRIGAIVLAVSCSQAMGAVVGGGTDSILMLYGAPPTGGIAAPVGILNGAAPLAGFNDYVGVSSGVGKRAFLTNDSNGLVWDFDGNPGTAPQPVYIPPVAVDYAASDSILSATELSTYRAAHQSPAVPTTSAENWGPIVQLPSAIMSITIPYKLTLANGTAVNNLNLTSNQLCEIFSGNFTTWNQINSSYPATPIKVHYRVGSAGTSEIFTRHLNSQCPAKFITNSTFATAVGVTPPSFVAELSDRAIIQATNSTDGAIGYIGPSELDVTNNAVVARVNGILPPYGNVTTALSTIAPPAVADRGLPENWAKVLANPASGYSIIGYTFLNFNQCYKDANDTLAVRGFINRHYNVNAATNNDNAIIAARLIPLTTVWKTAVRASFWASTSSLSIGHATACNSIGRPL